MFYRLCVLLIILALPAGLPAEDWPQWRGPNRDGISTETGLLKKWPAGGPQLLWEKPLGSGYSAIAVVGDTLYTLCQRNGAEWAVAADIETGEERWATRMGKPHTFMNFDGPRSTPLVHDGRVYCIDANGWVLCADAKDGSDIWRWNMLEKFDAENLKWAVAMSPLIDGEKLLLNPGKSNDSSIVTVNRKTGDLIWKATAPGGGPLGYMAGYASPVIATLNGERQYIVFTGKGAVGIDDETGKGYWHFPWKTSYDVHAATPIVSDNHVFITSGYNKGAALIHVQPDHETELVWSSRVIRGHFGTPILYEGYLYGFDEQELVCVDFMTGEQAWGQKGYRKGTLMMAEGLFYVLGERGTLALIRPNTKKCEVISEFQSVMSDRRCWTMPTVANGRLYLRDESKMACYDIEAK